jgi:hypothetical protein
MRAGRQCGEKPGRAVSVKTLCHAQNVPAVFRNYTEDKKVFFRKNQLRVVCAPANITGGVEPSLLTLPLRPWRSCGLLNHILADANPARFGKNQ